MNTNFSLYARELQILLHDAEGTWLGKALPLVEAMVLSGVYTCTSQLGFEALLAGKKVKTYGMPIYAGWGLTEDTLSCPRRKRKRSVEELFYALYIAFAVHIDPFTSERCSLEQYLDSLLRLRTMYFASASSGERNA
jgi:capsular polysaccharide export protein